MRDKLQPAPEGQIWSGDDAAVVEGFDRLVVTTDVLVEKVDFRLDTFFPADIGWKAMAANVSDIAAMGGVPSYAVATITLRSDVTVEVFAGIADGLVEAAEGFDVALVGGDISEGAELTVAATVIGRADRVVTRRGARVGDAICVTGALGGAAGGLIALDKGLDAPDLVARQRRPFPRTAEGRALADVATAMIDVSDGLAVDLGHLVDASGLGCEIELDALPLHPGLDMLGVDPVELAVSGGEDFELLFTTANVEAVPQQVSATQIGVITDGAAMIGGTPLEIWKEKGWEHLRRR